MHRLRRLVSILLVLLIFAGGSEGQAQSLSPAAVQSLADSVAHVHVGPEAIPGAVVRVVHDTTVVFAEGYGTADVGTGRPDRVGVGSGDRLSLDTPQSHNLHAGERRL